MNEVKSFGVEQQGQMSDFEKAQAKKKAAEQMLAQKQTAEGEETQATITGGGSLLGGIIGALIAGIPTAGAGAAAGFAAGSAIGGAAGGLAGEAMKKQPSAGKALGQTAQLTSAIGSAAKMGSSTAKGDAGNSPTMSPQGQRDPLSGVKKFSQNA